MNLLTRLYVAYWCLYMQLKTAKREFDLARIETTS